MSAQIRPSVRSYNSWDSLRWSQRVIPQIDALIIPPVDTYQAGPILESQPPRRLSLAPSVTVRVDESATVSINPLYRLGWRSILQIVGVSVATCTLGIAASNLWLRLHHLVRCDIPPSPQ